MFDVGDKVVYPLHGAGVIEGIEEKVILGEKKKYFVMHMPVGEMKVMIPMENVDYLGLRQIVEKEAIHQVMGILGSQLEESNQNWNQRYRANMDKMKTGDIYELADVVRSLIIREREKGLSTGERKMLDQARLILISELALVQNINTDQVYSMIDNVLPIKNASV